MESLDSLKEDDETTVELTDTIRRFNAACAILTELNGQDYNRFAGLPANETSKQLMINTLDAWWEVTDRTSADETLDWLLTEGHRVRSAENMTLIEQALQMRRTVRAFLWKILT